MPNPTPEVLHTRPPDPLRIPVAVVLFKEQTKLALVWFHTHHLLRISTLLREKREFY
jgi:hypothetical protein